MDLETIRKKYCTDANSLLDRINSARQLSTLQEIATYAKQAGVKPSQEERAAFNRKKQTLIAKAEQDFSRVFG